MTAFLILAEREGFTRHIHVVRLSGNALRCAKWQSCHLVEPLQFSKLTISVNKKCHPMATFLIYLAEREGFEPSIRYKRIHTFQACAFDHSATSPNFVLCQFQIYFFPYIAHAACACDSYHPDTRPLAI